MGRGGDFFTLFHRAGKGVSAYDDHPQDRGGQNDPAAVGDGAELGHPAVHRLVDGHHKRSHLSRRGEGSKKRPRRGPCKIVPLTAASTGGRRTGRQEELTQRVRRVVWIRLRLNGSPDTTRLTSFMGWISVFYGSL